MKLENFYMNEALKEAKKVNKDSVPIGCVIVNKHTNEIVSRSNNNSFIKNDPFSHAEIKALKDISNSLGHNYLNDYQIYVTIEPCLTCFSLIRSFNIDSIFFGAENQKYGFSNFVKEDKIKGIKIIKNIKNDEAITLLQNFFKKLRSEKKKYKS